MDNIGVRITADPSAVTPGVEKTKTLIGGLKSFVEATTAKFRELGVEMGRSMSAGTSGAGALRTGIQDTERAVVAMTHKIHEGAESVRTFQMRAKEFAEVYVAMFAVEQISEFINKMGEAAEKIEHLSQQFGMSVAQVQQLGGIAAATGVPVDALTKGMGLLDRNMANAAMGSKNTKQALDAVGVSLNDGRTQMQKLEAVADKFSKMEDGPKKAALAMQLFGRSGRELIPVLNLGSAGIEQLNQKMQEYGVVNESAVEKGMALAESTNETKLGFMGIGNVLMDSLAPAFTVLVDGLNDLIKAFIHSYESGGIVKTILDIIGAAIVVVVDVVRALGEIFSEVWSAITEIVTSIGSLIGAVFGQAVPGHLNTTDQALNFFRSVIVLTKDLILDFVDIVSMCFQALGQTVITFGKIAWDALTLQWGSIEGDWSAGLGRIQNLVESAANKIRGRAGEMNAAFHGTLKFDSPKAMPMPKGGGDYSFDYTPKPTGGKEKKPKAAKDDLVQKLQEELEARKTAWAMEQDAQGTFQQYSLKSEADFWAEALSQQNLSAKDRLKIEQKYLAARQALRQDDLSKIMAGYKDELDIAGQNWSKKLKILQDEEKFISHMYGAESKEARAAHEEVVKARRQEAAQLQQIAEQVAQTEDALQMDRVDAAERAAQFEVDIGLKTEGQLLQAQRQFENQRYQIELNALVRKMQLLQKDPGTNPVEFAKLKKQIQDLERQHQAKMTQLAQQGALNRTRYERQGIQALAQSWGQTLSQMATRQITWSAGIKALWQGTVQAISGALASMLQDWIQRQLEAILIGKTQKLAEATGQIGANSAVAASGAYAATAAIPIVGPALAPAAAATAYAGSMSWMGALSALSAEGGDWQVREGLYHLHEKEMVLPAWAAESLRNSVSSGSSPMGGGGDGDVHVHIHAMDGKSVKRVIMDNRHAVGAAARRLARDNA